MEINKKIIKKLIESLEELKKSLKGQDIVSEDIPQEEEIEISTIRN